MYADELLKPWFDAAVEQLPEPRFFDCHTHIGVNDPSGFSVTRDQLLDSLELAGSRAAVFPLKEPAGYGEANLRAVTLAHEHPDTLIAFARLDPADEPLKRSEEALDAGARGIKLHPDGEQFDIGDPRLDDVYALADSRRLPIIIHAGPEVEGIGATALSLCERFPGARLILAHDALTDLSWIYEEVEEHPNLFFDTSWWGPVHTMALFALVSPSRILSASDIPYCSPLSGALTTIRCGLQAGISPEQLQDVLGAQFERLVDNEEPVDLGPPPGAPDEPLDPLLERVFVTLLTGLEAVQRGSDMGNAMTVTRHACKVSDSHPHARVMQSVTRLLDLYEEHADELPTGNQYGNGWDLIAAAALIARTPRAPLPEGGR
jgi:predicted TIM-barrel fold metal-dependent hydrolase